jgi:protein-S-isoprenylcysteine O-methyltransferase Ste14
MSATGRTRRFSAVLGTLAFLILAPGTVAGFVPWWISRWQFRPRFFGFAGFRVVGVWLIAAGLLVVLDSFARFAVQGVGTPAPVFPTETLVVKGFYRHVRNPMYVAVAWMILGQGLLLGDPRILLYLMIPCLAAHLFVVFYEEPTLRKSFGVQYETYCAHVPRWVPRLTGWR